MDFEEKAYLSEPYQAEFSSRVRFSEPAGESLTLVFLEKTYFYPESGGQPGDTGTLNGKRVLAVTDDPRGVAHLVEGEFEEGSDVDGKVDFDRRFDHMQQHSGQHILSRVFLDLLGLKTVGFHIGEESSTIDLEGVQPSDESMRKVELEANGLIMKDIPVRARVVSREDYKSMASGTDEGPAPRSRAPEDTGELRLVEIASVDINACCGTHVARTGEIGIVKITGLTRVRQSTRIDFVCGFRALRDYTEKGRIIDSLARVFSTGWREVGKMVEKITGDNSELRKEIRRLREQVASLKSEDIGSPDGEIAGIPLIKKEVDGLDIQGMREAAGSIRESGESIVLLGASAPAPVLVFARSPGIDVNMGQVLKDAASVMGARGGGGEDFAQGGGGDAALLAEALDRAERFIREVLKDE